MAVESAGPYASLHLAPDRQPRQHLTAQLQAGCPSCHPTNSVKALKVINYTVSQIKGPDIFSYILSDNCPICIIFGKNINKRLGNQKIAYFPTSPK